MSRSSASTALGAAGLVAVLLVLAPTEALAQEVLDNIVNQFQTQAKAWEASLKQAAVSLFWILAAIEFAVSVIFLALSGSGFQGLAAEIVKRVLVIGIFYFILENGSSVADAIVQSFKQLGQSAGGVQFAPSSIFNSGLNVVQKVLGNISFLEPFKALGLMVAAIVVIICFALIAALVIVTLVEMYIVTYAGIILLGFGGSNFTKDYAVRYLTYAVSVGLKLMVMALVVSIGQKIIVEAAQNFNNSEFLDVCKVIGVAVVLLAVVKTLPSMLQSIVTGSSVGSNNVLASMAGSAVGAAATAALGTAAVGAAAIRGGGSIGQMAGRAFGAVGGASFDRAAGLSGSRFGSIMGNAAARIRQSNQQEQAARLSGPANGGGGSRPMTSTPIQGSPTSAPMSGMQGAPAAAGTSPSSASASPRAATSAPPQTSPGASGMQEQAAAGAASPVASPAAKAGAAASAMLAAAVGGASPGGASGGSAPTLNAPAPPSTATSILQAVDDDVTSPTPSAASSAPASLDAPVRSPAATVSEAVPATSGTPSGHAPDGASAGTAPTFAMPSSVASTGEHRAPVPVPAAEPAPERAYAANVPPPRPRPTPPVLKPRT